MYRVGESRKIRSDKKRDIKPHIPFSLYDIIDRLSYITRKPIKDICEHLCIEGLSSSFVLDNLSPYFQKDYSPSPGTIFIAQSENQSRRIKIFRKKRRVNIRFKQNDHNRIMNLSYALGLTIASTTSLLLIHAVRDINIINPLIQSHQFPLDSNRINEISYVLKKIKKGEWLYETSR
jgi:hypothetical protein